MATYLSSTGNSSRGGGSRGATAPDTSGASPDGKAGSPYYAEMATNILLEKRARKLAEDDATRLYNRVRQLQKEEEKAQKRIQDTKKKANEIIKLRERNELVKQEKELRMAQLQELIEQQKLENQRMKEEAIKNKIEQENKVFADKVSVVQQTKEEKAELEKLLAESKLLSRKEALEQKEYIRKQQEDARKKIEQLKVAKLQMVSAMWGHARMEGAAMQSSMAQALCAAHPSLAGCCEAATLQPSARIADQMLGAAICRPRTNMSAGSRRRWMPSCRRSGRLSSW